MGNFNQEEYLQELYKATWYKMAYLAYETSIDNSKLNVQIVQQRMYQKLVEAIIDLSVEDKKINTEKEWLNELSSRSGLSADDIKGGLDLIRDQNELTQLFKNETFVGTLKNYMPSRFLQSQGQSYFKNYESVYKELFGGSHSIVKIPIGKVNDADAGALNNAIDFINSLFGDFQPLSDTEYGDDYQYQSQGHHLSEYFREKIASYDLDEIKKIYAELKRYNDTSTEGTVIDLDEVDLDDITVDGKLLSGKLLPILENLTYAATLTKSFEADFVEEVNLQKASPEELKLISSKTSSNNFKRIKRYLKFHPNDVEFIAELYKRAPSIARDKTISWHEKCFLMKAFHGMNVSVTRCFDKALYPVLQKCKTIGQARAAIALWDETNIFNKSSVMETLLDNKHMTKILDNMYDMNVKAMQKKAEYAYRQICRGKINDLHNSITNFFSRSEGNFDIDKYSFDDDMLSKTVSSKFDLENLSAENKVAIENLLINNANTEDAQKLIKLALEICHTSTFGIDEFDDDKLAKILKNNFLLNSIKHVKDTQELNELFNGYETVNRFCKSKKYVSYKGDVIKLIKSLKGKPKEIIKMFSLWQSPENIQLILRINRAVKGKINFENLTLEKLSAVEATFNAIIDNISDEHKQNDLIKYLLEFVNEKDATPEDIQKLQVLLIHKDKDLLDPLDQKYSDIPKREVVNMLYQHFLHLNKNGIYENDVAERRFDAGKLEKDELQTVLKKYRTDYIKKSQDAQMELLSKNGLSKEIRKYIVDNPSFALAVFSPTVTNTNLKSDPNIEEINEAYNLHKTAMSNVDKFFTNISSGVDEFNNVCTEVFGPNVDVEKVQQLFITMNNSAQTLTKLGNNIKFAHDLANNFNEKIEELNTNCDSNLIADILIKKHPDFVVDLLTNKYDTSPSLQKKLERPIFQQNYSALLNTISSKLPNELSVQIDQRKNADQITNKNKSPEISA